MLFLILNLFFLINRGWLEAKGVDVNVAIAGNILLFILVFLGFWMTYKSLGSANPQHFVRALYGSFILKFFVLAIAAFVYIMVVKEKVNKPALIACLFMYVLYTVVEVRRLQKLLRKEKNGKA